MQEVEVIEAAGAAAIALDPVRMRLLAELRAPASAASLAARVGLSRQKVNYHLNKLQAHGLIEDAGTRRWGGLTERLLVATAAAYIVSPEAMGDAGSNPGRLRDKLSAAYVIALAARSVREVGSMSRNALRDDKRLPVLGLDTDIRIATPADRAALANDLTAAVARLVSKYHDIDAPDGRWQRLVVAVHPVPRDVDPSPPEEARLQPDSVDEPSEEKEEG